MKHVALPSGELVPALGLGTWRYGEDCATRADEIATVHLALDLGMRLIDTAEMYGEGLSESLVGEAIAGRRDDAFIVTKVCPHDASRRGAMAACERSLKRLGTDRIDLYLLHWRGSVPLAETMEAFLALRQAGKIRHFGVSNLDLEDMKALSEEKGADGVAVNQLLYNLTRRGIEFDLLPWLRERRIPLMAYSPIEQARLLDNRKLVQFARAAGMTPVQAALAWLLSDEDVIAIPKTASLARLRENYGALQHPLDASQLRELDRLFPPPTRAQPLEML
ncbi:MAG: aldo/keto reductase [Burkholderiales bacterium]|nr:aldo/keto reductase [Burkholderiales bacterium]